MDGVAYLISSTFEFDEIGQEKMVPGEPREVLVTEGTVGRDEFFEANIKGLRPEIMLETAYINYDHEHKAIYEGEEYSIYRTYHRRDDDIIELYLGKKVGDIG